MRACATVLTLLVVAPAHAADFRAKNGVSVRASDNGFLVTGDAGLGARGIWCAASDYARSRAGATNGQRLYIAQGRTPGLGRRDPVAFTLDPAGLTPTSPNILAQTLRQAGANLSVGHAIGFCADGKLRGR